MKLLNNRKIFLIAGLVVVLFGMLFLGIFGLNKTVDYKDSYEIKVSVDQNVKNSSEVLSSAAEKYFSDNGIKLVGFGTQKIEDGESFIYKAKSIDGIDAVALKNYVQAALDEKAEATGIVASAEVYKTSVSSDSGVFKSILAICIAAVVIMVLAMFIVKFAGAFTVIFNSVIAALIFVSLVAIVRVPAQPFFYFALAIAVLFSAVLSFTSVYKYRREIKADSKADLVKISDETTKMSLKLICVLLCAAVLFTLVAAIFGSVYFIFAGLLTVIALISASCVSLIGSPFFFNALRKK